MQTVAEFVEQRYGGRVAEIGRQFPTYGELRSALDELPGWGPVTVELFLRELRGVLAGTDPPLNDRAGHDARISALSTPAARRWTSDSWPSSLTVATWHS